MHVRHAFEQVPKIQSASKGNSSPCCLAPGDLRRFLWNPLQYSSHSPVLKDNTTSYHQCRLRMSHSLLLATLSPLALGLPISVIPWSFSDNSGDCPARAAVAHSPPMDDSLVRVDVFSRLYLNHPSLVRIVKTKAERAIYCNTSTKQAY